MKSWLAIGVCASAPGSKTKVALNGTLLLDERSRMDGEEISLDSVSVMPTLQVRRSLKSTRQCLSRTVSDDEESEGVSK